MTPAEVAKRARPQGCDTKRKFDTREEAEKFIRFLRGWQSPMFYPKSCYYCVRHDAFHLTHYESWVR